MSKIFTFEEPVTKGLGVSQEKFYVVAEKECQLAAEDGLSFIAIEQATGNVIGFAICRDLKFDCAHMGEVDPLIILPEIAAFVKELDNDFIKKMNFSTGDCLQMCYSGVDCQFRKKGIVTRLTEKVLKNAVTKGYKYAMAECTSLKSQKSLADLGFREENRIAYANLHYNTPNPWANLEGYCTLMMKEINEGF